MASKSLLRAEMKRKLKEITLSDIRSQSHDLTRHLHCIPQLNEKNSVSVYLSMGGEVDTSVAIKELIDVHNKQVYIPKITGKEAKDMIMLPLSSFDEIDRFPRNSWGIPEPLTPSSYDESTLGDIDLVLLPGVVFDLYGGRLGHGKGYYDCFVERLCKVRIAQGKDRPYLVGLALRQQVLGEGQEVPMEEHDRRLDFLLTCDGLLALHAAPSCK